MKKILWAAGISVAVVAGAIFILPMAVSSNGMRTALADQLSRISGAEITLNGPVQFSVVPDFGIVVEDIGYATPDGAFAVTSERSVASVALLPLFTGQIQVTGIELRTPRILLGQGSVATEAAPSAAPADSGDIFKTIAGYLENISIDHITVTDGAVAMRSGGETSPIASDIDLRLAIPGVDAPASLDVAATMDGNRMELTAELGSLEDLLGRAPSRFSISAKTSQPAHPALADLKASGSIQLAEDGIYRIAEGEVDSAGQKMQLDLHYAPGDRPSVVARVKAGSLAYADFVPVQSGETPETTASAGPVDLSALKSLDADIELYAEALSVGDAVARDVVLSAVLNSGKLIATVDSTAIAGGSLVASMALDANAVPSVASGSLNLTTIDIGQLLALAGQDAPVRGALSSELQYAFKGLDAAAITNSLNLRGSAAIANGRVEVSQLAAIAGEGANVIDGLTANVRIEDMTRPMTVSGAARWKGEDVRFNTSLTASQLLWGETSNVAVSVETRPVNASFSGTLTPSGRVTGRAEVASPSLSQAMTWLGQNPGTPLGRLAFSGGVDVDGPSIALTDTRLQLDDIAASGALSLALSGKPTLTANLAVETLDFSTLIGSGGDAPAAATGPAPIDLSMLRLFNADIRLSANQLGYGKVRMGPATAALTVSDGVARLAVPQAGFYDGVISADITANGAGNVPSISVVAGMEGVKALPLLSDAAGFDKIEGRLKASVEVSGAGGDSYALARSLNGPVNLVVNDGALRGIDVAGLVRNVRSLIGGGYSEDSNARTEFSELSIPVVITNGVAQASDIRVLGPFVRMSGAGSVDLADQTINMRLDPRVVGSLDGQGGDFDVSGLGMPIMVTGPLSGPSIYPDLSAVLADPNRALQALTQLGGGVGELAGGASNLIEGLGTALGDQTGTVGNTLVNDALGQVFGGQNPTTGGEGGLLNNVLGNALGQQFPGLLPPAQNPGPVGPAPVPPPTSSTIPPLPPVDPRGPQPVPSAPQPPPQPAPPPAEPVPPSPEQQLFDLLAPQPAQDGQSVDPLQGLFNELGF